MPTLFTIFNSLPLHLLSSLTKMKPYLSSSLKRKWTTSKTQANWTVGELYFGGVGGGGQPRIFTGRWQTCYSSNCVYMSLLNSQGSLGDPPISHNVFLSWPTIGPHYACMHGLLTAYSEKEAMLLFKLVRMVIFHYFHFRINPKMKLIHHYHDFSSHK